VTGSGSWAGRSEWEPFGPYDLEADTAVVFDPQTGTYVPGNPEELHDSFTRFGLTAVKEW
jgi:hypothetical protein